MHDVTIGPERIDDVGGRVPKTRQSGNERPALHGMSTVQSIEGQFSRATLVSIAAPIGM
ncbi:hypothetical protein [Methylobacterium planeticum]|uniref:hypothetical protein n=1 Tax=Methylobacterium planeticum TaxID=2615211 RepID=UPI00177C8E38|nr:hypothetical protein [Methylobacterium planeticum]